MEILKLAIYDFDGTIYKGDSAVDFWFFMLSKKPVSILYVPYQLFILFLNIFGISSMEKVKETFFLPVNKLDPNDLDILVKEFWQNNIYKINDWFYDKSLEEKGHMYKVVCISASPDFLLDKIATSLGFDKLICTRFERTGFRQSNKIIGLNCRGNEKVSRLKEWLTEEQILNFKIERFYSDSFSDRPLFNLAIDKYLIKNGRISILQ